MSATSEKSKQQLTPNDVLQQPKVAIPVTAFDRWLAKALQSRLGNLPVQVILWDSVPLNERQARPLAVIRIHDRGMLLRLCLDPIFNFGEGYSSGRIEVEGDLVELCLAADECKVPGNQRFLSMPRWLEKHRNTLAGSKSNIHQHYDLGNDFYKLWLDRDLVYTCAYFPEPDMSLEEAQSAKLEHICRKLQLKPGQSVVEAGCGWGALSLYMARNYGVKVRAYNISREQVKYARQRSVEEGLVDQVEFIEDDWRKIEGKYDAFVSVGMLEHIGLENYTRFGEMIENSLHRKGVGLVHSIGRNFPAALNCWTEERIFPGANPPSLSQMTRIFEGPKFSILDVENLRLHYAETIRHWLERFESHRDVVAEMFGEEFVRMWRLYLSGSIASFLAGKFQLFQVTFSHARNNSIPRNRKHLYQDTLATSQFMRQ